MLITRLKFYVKDNNTNFLQIAYRIIYTILSWSFVFLFTRFYGNEIYGSLIFYLGFLSIIPGILFSAIDLNQARSYFTFSEAYVKKIALIIITFVFIFFLSFFNFFSDSLFFAFVYYFSQSLLETIALYFRILSEDFKSVKLRVIFWFIIYTFIVFKVQIAYLFFFMFILILIMSYLLFHEHRKKLSGIEYLKVALNFEKYYIFGFTFLIGQILYNIENFFIRKIGGLELLGNFRKYWMIISTFAQVSQSVAHISLTSNKFVIGNLMDVVRNLKSDFKLVIILFLLYICSFTLFYFFLGDITDNKISFYVILILLSFSYLLTGLNTILSYFLHSNYLESKVLFVNFISLIFYLIGILFLNLELDIFDIVSLFLFYNSLNFFLFYYHSKSLLKSNE